MTIKFNDVSYQSAVCKPIADCQGNDDEDCEWDWRPAAYANGKAKDQAKRHVMDHPTHSVRVLEETVTIYYVPDHVLSREESEKAESNEG
jgi:hypothetical protein